ncbi:hypothetical protein D3C76_524380 [compost metagenome]
MTLQRLCMLQGLPGGAGCLCGGAAVQVQADARQRRCFHIVGVHHQALEGGPGPCAAGAVEQVGGALQTALQQCDSRALQSRAGDEPGEGLFVAERFQLRQQQVGALGIAGQAGDARQYAVAGDQLVRGRHCLEHWQIEVQQALGFRQFVAFVQRFGEYGYRHDTAGQMAHGVRRGVGRCGTQAGDGAAQLPLGQVDGTEHGIRQRADEGIADAQMAPAGLVDDVPGLLEAAGCRQAETVGVGEDTVAEPAVRGLPFGEMLPATRRFRYLVAHGTDERLQCVGLLREWLALCGTGAEFAHTPQQRPGLLRMIAERQSPGMHQHQLRVILQAAVQRGGIEPAHQQAGTALPQQVFGVALQQADQPLAVGAAQGVLDGRYRPAHLGIPGAGAAMQQRHAGRFGLAQLAAEKLPEQRVIAVPAPLGVLWAEEQLRGFDLRQQGSAVAALQQVVAEWRAEFFEDAAADQEFAQGRRLAGQHVL